MAVVHIDGSASTSVVKETVAISVWVKRLWAHSWEFAPYLEPIDAVESVAPAISNAEFLYHYGNIKREDSASGAIFIPARLKGYYVAIYSHSVFGTAGLWVGIIQEENYKIDGGNSGDLTLKAYGLEHLLNQKRIYGSYVEGGATNIGRLDTFNQRYSRGPSASGNRTTSANGDGIYTFSRDGADWTNLDIAFYVLFYHQDDNAITFALSGQVFILDNIVTRMDLEGLTPFDALNKLIDRRRGVGWRILSSGAGTVHIHVFSILETPITIGSFSLPANGYQDSINSFDLIDLRPKLHVSQALHYDKVVVRGERVITCMSWFFENSTLERAWTAGEEAAYEAETEDDERATDKYERVFSTVRVPRGWNWTYTTIDDSTPAVATPFQNSEAEFFTTSVASAWNQGHKFERWIPLEVPGAVSDTEPEFREPFAWVEVPGEPFKFIFLDKLATIELSRAQIRMLDREMGFTFSSRINHIFGLDTFDGDSDIEPEVDYRSMGITAAVKTDHHMQVTRTITNAAPTEVDKTLFIEVADAHFWWMADGTVTDITDRDHVFSGPTVLRDDSERLRAIATFAQAWYGQQRATIEYVFDGIGVFHPAGMLITAAAVGWNVEKVGTVVTERRWNFKEATTSVRTGWQELDVRAVGGALR